MALPHGPRVAVCLAVLLLTVTTWPVRSLFPTVGLDNSWQAGLAMAADRGLDFGHDLVFTYGPLGFLGDPKLYVGWEAALGLLYNGILNAALAALVFVPLRRRLGFPLALAATFAVLSIASLSIVGLGDRLTVVVAIACLVLLERPDGRRAWVAPVLGVALAAAVLVKFTAVALVPLVAVCAWRLPPGRLRALLHTFGASLGAFLGLWLATRNDLRDIPRWVVDSFSIATGFDGALYRHGGDEVWQIPVAAIVVALLAAASWYRCRDLGRRRVLVVAATLFVCWIVFKQGFVRLDQHSFLFLSMTPVIALATLRPGRGEKLSALAALIAVVAALGAFRIDLRDALDPIGRANAVGDQFADALVPGRRHRIQRIAREQMTAAFGLDPSLVRRVGRSTVQVLPFELSTVWALGLNWRPTPVFQDYSVYTPRLGRRAASFLASADAPEYVLVHASAGSSEFAQWSPDTVVALNCDYRLDMAAGTWRLLRRDPGRCGAEVRLSEHTIRATEAVAVPAPGPRDLVVVRVVLPGRSPWQRLRALVYRSAESPPQIAFDDSTALRLVPAMADRPRVLRVGTDATISGVVIPGGTSGAVTVLGIDGAAKISFSRIPVVR